MPAVIDCPVYSNHSVQFWPESYPTLLEELALFGRLQCHQGPSISTSASTIGREARAENIKEQNAHKPRCLAVMDHIRYLPIPFMSIQRIRELMMESASPR